MRRTGHAHRFGSPEARDRFFDWFYTDANFQLAQRLLAIGWNAGSDELGRVLDDVADQPQPARREPRGRRRGRRTPVLQGA